MCYSCHSIAFDMNHQASDLSVYSLSSIDQDDKSRNQTYWSHSRQKSGIIIIDDLFIVIDGRMIILPNPAIISLSLLCDAKTDDITHMSKFFSNLFGIDTVKSKT